MHIYDASIHQSISIDEIAGRECCNILSDDPRVFYERYLQLSPRNNYGKKMPMQMNIGLENSLKLITRGQSHMLYNPRQTGKTHYLAAIATWAKIACPKIRVNLIHKSINDRKCLTDICDNLEQNIPAVIRKMAAAFRYSQENCLSEHSIRELYLVDEFEFLSEDDIRTILDDIIPNREILFIGASTINQHLEPELLTRINESFHWMENPFLRWDSVEIPCDKIPALIYHETCFFTQDQLDEFKTILDYNRSKTAYITEVERKRLSTIDV